MSRAVQLLPYFRASNPVWAALHGAPLPGSGPPPAHVIPAVDAQESGGATGLMVPLALSPASNWHVSDAFGRFGGEDLTIWESFDALLGTIERCWRRHFGVQLPLRWRSPLAISVEAPVHLKVIAGHSLEWPLALAVLRAAAGRGVLPFGDGPVFATGLLLSNGSIGPAGHVREKLSGFWREYGRDRPVLLSPQQRDSLQDEELEGATVHVVDHLSDLFFLDAFRPAAAALNAPATAWELDSVLRQGAMYAGELQFDRVKAMTEWALPAAQSLPHYAFRIRMQRGAVLLHGGRTAESEEDWAALRALLASNRDAFDADDRAMLAAHLSTFELDCGRCDPAAIMAFVREQGLFAQAPCGAEAKAYLLGELSQLHRAAGACDEALEYGQAALQIARARNVSQAGKYANFVVHAHLTRARERAHSRSHDLDKAWHLLQESKSVLAPAHDEANRASHLGFCRHYEAEWNRLRGVPCLPPAVVRPPDYWTHPDLFAMLAAARNWANPVRVQQVAAQSLVSAAEEILHWADTPIFRLFHSVYRVVYAQVCDDSVAVALGQLDALLQEDACLIHWRDRLGASIRKWQADGGTPDRNSLDRLCDAIPHH